METVRRKVFNRLKQPAITKEPTERVGKVNVTNRGNAVRGFLPITRRAAGVIGDIGTDAAVLSEFDITTRSLE